MSDGTIDRGAASAPLDVDRRAPATSAHVYTVSRRPGWADLAERVPQPVWDAFRRTRWRLFARRLRGRTIAEAAAVHWLFVVGCSNSGTTLLAQLLGESPEIAALPYEGQLMTPAVPRPWELGVDRVFSERADRFRLREDDRGFDVHHALYDWLRGRGRARRRFLLVKSPSNMLMTRWLQARIPRCSFVAIVRDGRAVSEGIRRRRGYEIARSARHWARAHETLLEDAPRLRSFHLVRYEDLCERPLATIEALAAFLGIEAGPLSEAARRTWSIHNLTDRPSGLANFNAASFARLSAADREAILAEAAPLLARFGYLDDAPA